nr:baculoviral IAP repeat-containing protein 7-B-like [Phallusia mammillata]
MNPNSLQDRIFSLQHHPTIADTLARNGFYCSGNNNSATCYRCGFQISNIRRMAHFVHPCGNGIADLANIPSSSHENFLKHLDLTRESERIRTFEDWPSETPSVSPTALARSGFFYLGNLDRVQCFSCGGALKNWQLGDNVQTEHRRHFSHCKMSKGSEMRNVPLATDEQATVLSQHTEGPPDLSEDEAEVLRESFPCQEPANPHMRNETNRLQTFNQEWGDAQVDATSSELAKAGFFYLGSRDQVKCWYCNGGLRNWEPDQEPWAEHAKWYPSCEFLLRHKGPNFVHRIVAQFPNLRRPVMQTNSNTPRPLTQMINYPIVQSGSRQEFLASLNLANETDRL